MLCLELGCIGRIVPRFGAKVLQSTSCKRNLEYISSSNCLTVLLQNNRSTKYRQFSTSQNVLNSSLPDGLLDYAQHKIQNPDQQFTNFSVLKSLENAVNDLKSSIKDKKELQEMLNDPDGADPDMVKMATADIEMLDGQMVELVNQIKDLVVPKERYDNEDAIIEVVPGAGGLEANMFAEEIFNMYLAYVAHLGCTVGEVERSMSSVGKQSNFSSTSGITHASAQVSGFNVFGQLKFESGVHRVQRVPVTGNKNDRLQTSTCSVAILPKARDLEMSLPAKDLKYEFMRSSGAGGQGVNTTDSACRLTHLPTGLFVKCQEERSQQQNKKKALDKLQNMLYQREFDEMIGKVTSSRKLQVGNMNRNEKIRTYNFSRHMLTEHRIKMNETFPSIVGFLSGNFGFEVLEEMHRRLAEYDKEQIFLEIIQNVKNSSNSSSQ